MTEPDTLRCARHPDVETGLRCGKCGTPICPKCMVQTPVGARCKQCAGLRALPTFRVPPVYYLRAAGAALGAGIVIGLVWGLIELYMPSFFFSILLAAGSGWAIGEIISRSVNRKRSIGLAVIGGLAVLIALGIAYGMELNRFGVISFTLARIAITMVSAGIGIYMAVLRLH